MTESTITRAHSTKRRDNRHRPATLLSSKTHAELLERLAIVFVRQSSPRQVEENIESTPVSA